MTYSSRLAAVVLAAVLLAGCGERDVDEAAAPPADTTADAERLDELQKRTERLERELARREAQVSEDEVETGRGGELLKPSHVQEFGQFAATLDGEVGVTVGEIGDANPQTLGDFIAGAAWSTIKVPIALRVTADAGGPGKLNSGQRDQIQRALTASDNEAAAALWASLASEHGGADGAASAVGEVLSVAGDTETRVSTVGRASFSPYGQTEWSLRAQHQFVSALAAGCLAEPATTKYLLDLMGSVVGDQRWGLGSSGRSALFKGGWGPEPDGAYLVRQMGVIDYDPGRGGIVVTLAAKAADGSFESGTSILTSLAGWLAEHLPATPRAAAPC